LDQLDELISLDSILCPSVFKKVEDHFWPHIAKEAFYSDYFTDLEVLRSQLVEKSGYRILRVVRNPAETQTLSPVLSGFELVGFDLVEAGSGVSALNNCGGWPELNNAELNKFGLVDDFERALNLQEILLLKHPEEHHADCDVWAIWVERPNVSSDPKRK